ncbi:hypothetical protein ACWEOE_00195, partial [Amycolatopsis sp. NPDC004368]
MLGSEVVSAPLAGSAPLPGLVFAPEFGSVFGRVAPRPGALFGEPMLEWAPVLMPVLVFEAVAVLLLVFAPVAVLVFVPVAVLVFEPVPAVLFGPVFVPTGLFEVPTVEIGLVGVLVEPFEVPTVPVPVGPWVVPVFGFVPRPAVEPGPVSRVAPKPGRPGVSWGPVVGGAVTPPWFTDPESAPPGREGGGTGSPVLTEPAVPAVAGGGVVLPPVGTGPVLPAPDWVPVFPLPNEVAVPVELPVLPVPFDVPVFPGPVEVPVPGGVPAPPIPTVVPVLSAPVEP